MSRVFLSLLALASCTTPVEPETPRPVHAPPQALVTPAPTPAPSYERPRHQGKLDPFAPMLWAAPPSRTKALGPLERVPVGQLALVAIISEVAAPRAMFITPDGLGHLVHEGERVQGGVIHDIRNHEVELRVGTQPKILRLFPD